MKFPYGICDFRKIITRNFFYCDRTDRIPLLERGEYLLFLRPRRFGKSLLLSMLANYYDVAKKDEFDQLFGSLKIAANPTPLHNRYFILKWDFSCVDPWGHAYDIRKALHNHINACIQGFVMYYEEFGVSGVRIDYEDAVYSIRSLIDVVRKTGHPIYLLIDEYDNFANQVLMGVRRNNREIYESLVFEEGPLRTLFKAVKSSTSESLFDRIFITGVSPVVMSDITSGYNIGKNIYLKPYFNDLCGFTQMDIDRALRSIASECDLKKADISAASDMMRTYYNGYRFASTIKEPVYNPTLSIYFLDAFYETCKYPRNMLDANLSTDDAKLEYISRIPGGRQLLADLSKKEHQATTPDLSGRFGIREMTLDQGKDNPFMVSFLYYFGVLTIGGETEQGEISLKVPNLVMRRLYVEKIGVMLLPEPTERDAGKDAAKRLYQYGEMQPLCDFVEKRYFRVFRNRDYRWVNELTVKTAFLTLLYNDILFIMDSEKEIASGYADLTMIIRPDMRRFKITDILIEFKFVRLKDAGVTSEEARQLTSQALRKIPVVRSSMDQACSQAGRYGEALEQKYGNLRLRKYAVVSLGFERLWWEEV